MSKLEELLEIARIRRSLPSFQERKRIRIEADVSGRELGAAIGVSYQAIRRWETDNQPRGNDHVRAYALALRALEELVHDQEPTP